MLKTVGRTGQRAVISTGWGGLRPENPSDDVHVVDGVPHDSPVPPDGGGRAPWGRGHHSRRPPRSGNRAVICPFDHGPVLLGSPCPRPRCRARARAAEEALSGAPRGRHRLCGERRGGRGGVARTRRSHRGGAGTASPWPPTTSWTEAYPGCVACGSGHRRRTPSLPIRPGGRALAVERRAEVRYDSERRREDPGGDRDPARRERKLRRTGSRGRASKAYS